MLNNLEHKVRGAGTKKPQGTVENRNGEVIVRHDLIGKTEPVSAEKAQEMSDLALLREARKLRFRGINANLVRNPTLMTDRQREFIQNYVDEKKASIAAKGAKK